MAQPIKIWEFYDAPLDLRALSNHGGDEDYVALVPAEMEYAADMLLYSGSPFGVSDVQKEVQADGSFVYIGAHA